MNDATMQQPVPVVKLPRRRRLGRPPGSRNKVQLDAGQRMLLRKDCDVSFRATQAQLTEWRQAAHRSGLTFTQWATIALINEARR